MENVHYSKESIIYALQNIKDGFIFEDFAQSIIGNTMGHKFIPVGGTKDKGVDGFQHIFSKDTNEKHVFQISTEIDVMNKIEDTLKKLKDNKIKCDILYYISNRDINNKDNIVEYMQDNYKKHVVIWDQTWILNKVLQDEKCRDIFITFINSYYHVFNKPGSTYEVRNLGKDSRIYVFLRQQLEEKDNGKELDGLLADSLILYSLEGTDPDKDIFRTKNEIIDFIKEYAKFDPKKIDEIIDRRLVELTKKPRKIHFHSKRNAFCLPYETRIEITNKNLQDKMLYDSFFEETEEKFKKHLDEENLKIRDAKILIEEVLQKIYYQQGLEFSNFIINAESKEIVEKDLPDIIGQVVDDSAVIMKNKTRVKAVLLMVIRDIVYSGSRLQKEYLKGLSNTYMLMFLLQWDPSIASYFQIMASKLEIFVCTSIIIPAFSEFYLESENKRHWNLLKGAKATGIKLFVNEIIIKELVAHLRMIKSKYETEYKNQEEMYLNDEIAILYIDEILIRAYFYAKKRNKTFSFDEFLDNFVSINSRNIKEELITYLKSEFGIHYQAIKDLGVDIRELETEEKEIFEILKDHKRHTETAHNDSLLMLTIFKLREKNNEINNKGIFGYKTWWLSKDTSTYRAILQLFGDKYPVSCYMRPDFLYNYITLAPKTDEIKELYERIFPTMLGVNLGFHIPKDVTNFVREKIIEYRQKEGNQARLDCILLDLAENIKTNSKLRTKKAVKLHLDEELKKLTETN